MIDLSQNYQAKMTNLERKNSSSILRSFLHFEVVAKI
jgi:hypothetical protein